MIFARRALQSRLDELRTSLGDTTVNDLVSHLNRPDDHRLAWMWETVVLHALSKLGSLRHEFPLPSGTRPDVEFTGQSLSFIADVTAISDKGFDANNPYQEFSTLIEQAKTRLNLPPGGVDLHVLSRVNGGRRTLRLPKRENLQEFVQAAIEPRLRAQIQADNTVLHIVQDDEVAGFQVTIDPRRSPISTGRHAAYDVPAVRNRNPLYRALERKAEQLEGAQGLTGIIVGDADSQTLADRQPSWNEISAREIVSEFLKQYSSIGFVLLLSVREEAHSWPRIKPPERRVHSLLVARNGASATEPLVKFFEAMVEEMPKPATMPVNAALRAREAGYGWGHHGGYKMSRNRIKISARELMELLAGRVTIERINELHNRTGSDTSPEPNQMVNQFERQLHEGRLPKAISVIKTDENDSDDWIEFEFGDPDPSISPFR